MADTVNSGNSGEDKITAALDEILAPYRQCYIALPRDHRGPQFKGYEVSPFRGIKIGR